MRRAIIACTLLLSFAATTAAVAQERARQPKLVYVAEKEATTSYWPSWKMPNLWPTGLGTRISSGTKSSWSSVKTGSSRAWYATKYTVAPWSKPAPPSLTGSRGVTSSKPKTQPTYKSNSKSKSSEASASWWPKLDFWNSDDKEQELKNVGDWQLQSSPAAGFDD